MTDQLESPPTCAGGILGELKAFKTFGNLLYEIGFDPKMNSKVTCWTWWSAYLCGLNHEMVTNSGKSAEKVAEQALGKGNFTALEGKVAIITGASNGLGLENARVMMKYGCHVIWAVRNPQKAENAIKNLGSTSGKATILKIDLSDLTTVKPFVQSFLKLQLPLHYLILNAGIMAPPEWRKSAQGFEEQFATNNLGHFLLSELLMQKIEDTAKTSEVRIVILSSAAGLICADIDPAKLPCPQEEYHEFGDYCVTKACDAFHARSLQKRFAGKNVFAVSVHPGIIGTGLLRDNDRIGRLFYQSATFYPYRKGLQSGTATQVYCALSPDVPEQVKKGSFFYYNRGPQKGMNAMKPGNKDYLVDALEKRQMELVKPYM